VGLLSPEAIGVSAKPAGRVAAADGPAGNRNNGTSAAHRPRRRDVPIVTPFIFLG
jgi:hypothetical protein